MARKTSMRDYQAELSARFRDAAQSETVATRLAFEAGDERWLVDLSEAGEVIPLPPVVPVPLTRSWFLGVANVRGNLRAIVDFGAFHGAPAAPNDDAARLLMIGDRHHVNGGLLVRRVVGLRRVDLFTALPDAPQRHWEAGYWADSDRNVWRLLDVGALVTSPEFLHVENLDRV
jgi:twitching motility protein PilI